LALKEGGAYEMFVNIGQWSVQVSTVCDDYLPSIGKAVLSISGNVHKQQEMEIDKLINDVLIHYLVFLHFFSSPFRLVRSNTWVQ
jgi:hypothetical protein